MACDIARAQSHRCRKELPDKLAEKTKANREDGRWPMAEKVVDKLTEELANELEEMPAENSAEKMSR